MDDCSQWTYKRCQIRHKKNRDHFNIYCPRNLAEQFNKEFEWCGPWMEAGGKYISYRYQVIQQMPIIYLQTLNILFLIN